jgi:multisubunit Na+/H+ antiporter MnhG subunit
MTPQALDIIFNIIGTGGVILILLAYFMIQSDRLHKHGFAYSFMNLIGSILIFISLLHSWNLPSVIIEVFWFIISLYGLFRWWRLRDKNNNNVN